MFGLLPIEGSWFLRFEKLFKEFFRKSPLNGLYTPFGSPVPGGQKPSLPLKRGIFRKPTRPPLPLREAPPLTPTLSPQERGRKPLLLVARNRYALRLAGHQSPRQIVRDGTAWVLLACELVMGLLLLACGLLRGMGTAWVRGVLMGLVPLLPRLIILILT